MVQGIKVGIRPSLLAFKQAEEVQHRLSNVVMNIVRIKTAGDLDKVTPLSYRENSDFFTGAIEIALLEGSIDAAIHSAKDLAEEMPAELTLAAMTKTVSPHDCLVALGDQRLEDLPAGSRVGTSSQARKEGILRYRHDLAVKDIRGNVDERLRQLDDGLFDAIVVADAALIRLGWQHRRTQYIPKEIIKPHPLQGRLAIQIRKDRDDLKPCLEGLHGH